MPSRWRELDILRGFAAACMIFNHLAVKSPGIRDSSLISWSEFIGGFAPVLFYLATGIGNGLRATEDDRKRPIGYLKICVLLVADLDFFVFIGLSLLVLEFVRRSRNGAVLAAVIAIISIATRFVVAPLVRTAIKGKPWEGWAGEILGTGGSFGYPLGPWLAYPMAGYLIGQLATRHRAFIETTRKLPLILVGLGLPFGLLTLAMVWRGSDLFRYGSMSFAYFLASVFVIALMLSGCLILARTQWLSPIASGFSLEGLRSFAVVPIHYTMLEIIGSSMGWPVDGLSFAGFVVPVLVASFWLSWLFVRSARWLDRPVWRQATFALVFLFTLAYYAVLRHRLEGIGLTELRSAFQLSLCVILMFRDAPMKSRKALDPASSTLAPS